MTTAKPISIVQRKLAAASKGAQYGERSALRALRLAFARAASEVFELPLAVIGAKQRRSIAEELAGYIDDDWLLMMLDGPDGQLGVLLLDPASVASLIQHQTMGKVSGGDVVPRTFTNTDAAMMVPLINKVLANVESLIQLESDKRCLNGYQFGSRFEDSRTLLLALEADKFRIFELALDFSGGISQGIARLILPDIPEPVSAKTVQGPRMGEAVGGATAELKAVVCRLRMNLTELSALVIGDLVPLMQGRLDRTELLSISGQRVTSGQLGQSSGFKAVRLSGYAQQLLVDGGDFDSSLGLPAPMSVTEPGSESTMPDAMITADAALELGDGTDSQFSLMEDDNDAMFVGLSAQEAVLEISELAGLPLPGEDSKAS